MITVKPKITQKLEVDIVTDDGKDVNHILEEICRIAHDRLEAASTDRQELEDKREDAEPEDIISTLESIIDYLEGGFCQILNILKD